MTEAVIKVVFGKRGCGKSTKAAALVRDRRRVLFYDTLGHDYSEGVVTYELAELKAFWLQHYRGPFRIVYRPADPEGDLPEVSRLVYLAANLSFVAEEVDLYFHGGQCCPEFNQLIMRGRHTGVEMVCVTQRPKGFGRSLTAQAYEFFLFHTREPADLDYFKDRLGIEIATTLGSLEQFQYLHYVDYGGTDSTFEVCKDAL